MEQLVRVPASVGSGERYQGKGSSSARFSSVSLDVQPAACLLGAPVVGCEGGETKHGKIGHGQGVLGRGGGGGFNKLRGHLSLGGI